MKIPFTLEKWLEDQSQKVETKDGHPVRIVCTNVKNGEKPDTILGLRMGNLGYENATYYDINGKCLSDGTMYRQKDLVIVTNEPELTVYEAKVQDCITKRLTHYQKVEDGSVIYSSVYIDNITAKAIAEEVLELAAEELSKNGKTAVIEDSANCGMSVTVDAEGIKYYFTNPATYTTHRDIFSTINESDTKRW